MTHLQRHFYRALLLAAFDCRTAPDLPSDEALLWHLADAESLEVWQANKGPVLAMFKLVVNGEGHVLVDSTLREEWRRLVEWRKKSKVGGKASAASRSKKNQSDSEQCLNGGSTVVEERSNGGSTVVQSDSNQAVADGSSNRIEENRIEKNRKEKTSSSSSVGLVNGKATTTTSAPDLLLKELMPLGWEVDSVNRLWRGCVAVKPECTAEEVLRYYDVKFNQFKKTGKIGNWVGFLTTAVPKCFEEAESLKPRRAVG